MSVTEPESASNEVGAKVRRLRQAAGLTLAELASRGGVSKAHLSRMESGERSISLSTLLTLAKELQVAPAALMPAEDNGDVVHDHGPVVRADDLQVRALTHRTASAIQPFRVVVPANRSWADGVTHSGEEWIFVLKGIVTVHHGAAADIVSEGEAIHFDGEEPHRIASKSGAELIVVTEGRRPTREM